MVEKRRRKTLDEYIFSYTVGVTLSVSFIILALFSISKIIDKTFTAKFQYWLWMLFSLRLVLPINILKSKPLVQIQTPYRWLFKEPINKIAGAGGFAVQGEGILPVFSMFHILIILWLAGMVLYFTFVAVQYRRFAVNLKRWGRPLADKQAKKIFEMEQRRSGIPKKLEATVCPFVSTPMVVGLGSSTIVLPRENYTPRQLKMIFSHELVHCRRNDVLYQFLLVGVCGIHWFNPLVHIMARQARRSMEISCDSEAVEGQGLAFRRDYASAILEIAKGECEQRYKKQLLAANFSVSGSLLKKRFLNLFDFTPKRSGAWALLGLTVVLVLCGSLFVFRGSDRNIQWMQDVTAGEIKEIIYNHNGRRETMNRQQIQSIALWLNEMELQNSPLVRNTEKYMEQFQYQVITSDWQVYKITCLGEKYLNVNGKHYYRE